MRYRGTIIADPHWKCEPITAVYGKRTCRAFAVGVYYYLAMRAPLEHYRQRRVLEFELGFWRVWLSWWSSK